METSSEPQQKPGYSGRTVPVVVLLAVAVAIAATFPVVRTYMYPADFAPVQLTGAEHLDDKLDRLGGGRRRVALDLSDDLASARMLVAVPPD